MKLAAMYERHVLVVVLVAEMEHADEQISAGQNGPTIKMTSFADEVDGLTERRRSGIRRAIHRLADAGLLVVHRADDGLHFRLTATGRVDADELIAAMPSEC